VSLHPLSIVIPTINYAINRANIEYLFSSAQSIDAEVILVLDSCSDNDFEEVSRIAEFENGWLKVVQTNSQNPGGARNIGLQNCTSPWITFWDSDDKPYPHELMAMIQIAEKNGCDVAIGRYVEKVERNPIQNSEKAISSQLLNEKNWQVEVGLSPGIWRFAFRFRVVENTTFPELRMGEDQVFIQRVFKNDILVYLSEKIVYEYRIGSSHQLTANKLNLEELLVATDISLNEYSNVDKKFREIAKIMIIKKCLTLLFRYRGALRQKLRYSNQILLLSLRDFLVTYKFLICVLKSKTRQRMPN
jgi:glycosyltransferase involved in cell wall biosynthesis